MLVCAMLTKIKKRFKFAPKNRSVPAGFEGSGQVGGLVQTRGPAKKMRSLFNPCKCTVIRYEQAETGEICSEKRVKYYR